MEKQRYPGGRKSRCVETPVLFHQFEEESDGGLVFTTAAQRSWIKSKYQKEERMYEALSKLSEAAASWKQMECRIEERLYDWLRPFGLRYSHIDNGLERKNLHKFSFESRQYSRVHHIKLDDHVHQTAVGRIYFGIDTDDRRWIVDHVGLKLYKTKK
ncbi:hypothetical protein [Actinocorallia libanotica]|uniref:Uncharacterized protein n=1 Tax=Actinocorallia libanotica TaxID=46162 RepID=A0ABN1QW55_9ACTN